MELACRSRDGRAPFEPEKMELFYVLRLLPGRNEKINGDVCIRDVSILPKKQNTAANKGENDQTKERTKERTDERTHRPTKQHFRFVFVANVPRKICETRMRERKVQPWLCSGFAASLHQ